MNEVTLRLTPQQLDYVVSVLVQRPYAEVAGVLTEFQQQIARQQPGAPLSNGQAGDPVPSVQ